MDVLKSKCVLWTKSIKNIKCNHLMTDKVYKFEMKKKKNHVFFLFL